MGRVVKGRQDEENAPSLAKESSRKKELLSGDKRRATNDRRQ